MGGAMTSIELAAAVKQGQTTDRVLTRARRALVESVRHGVRTVQAFADVDPIAGLTGVDGVLAAKQEFRHLVDVQVVAFPQHGLELTDRSKLLLPVEVIVANVNRFVRGWAAYCRYGNSSRHFDKIRGYLRMRLALVISKRHRRSRAFGWSVIAYSSTNQLGLINLDGTGSSPVAWCVTATA